MEERDIAMAKLPCSFINSGMEGETVDMKMEVKMVDILAKLE